MGPREGERCVALMLCSKDIHTRDICWSGIGSNLLVESWLRGLKEGSYCQPQYKYTVLDVQSVAACCGPHGACSRAWHYVALVSVLHIPPDALVHAKLQQKSSAQTSQAILRGKRPRTTPSGRCVRTLGMGWRGQAHAGEGEGRPLSTAIYHLRRCLLIAVAGCASETSTA